MLLECLQSELEALYEIPSAYRINDFVTHDAALARRLDTSRNAKVLPEKLLIHQDGENIDVALYLDAGTMRHLQQSNPLVRLTEKNIREFWTVLEGISHFVYLSYNAGYDRPISLLELELQAEIDKYILSVTLLNRQGSKHVPMSLHHYLYKCAEFDSRLNSQELYRYHKANELAGKFSGFIERCFHDHMPGKKIINTLRRFYRLTHHQKIRSIEALPA